MNNPLIGYPTTIMFHFIDPIIITKTNKFFLFYDNEDTSNFLLDY